MPNATPTTASHLAGPALDHAALDRLLTSGALALPDLTSRRAEFKMYTAAATTGDDINPDTGNPRVRAIGSSTIRDLQGDTMELSALQDMQKAPPGLAIFVNHSYEVPEDVVGRLFDYPTAQMKRDIADLALDIEVLTNVNPRAKQLHAGILAGVRQGISIGCMITAAQWVDEDGNPVPDDEIDFWDIWEGRLHLHILGVDPLEWSFVGIPANQRSWVQYAAQGLFRRALRDRESTTAQRLAPLVRAWFPTDFQHDLLDLAGDDAALRKNVGEVAPRRGDGKHILWLPERATFGLRNPQTKRIQELSRERVGALLAGEAAPVEKAEKHLTPSEPTAATAVLTESTVEATESATASASTTVESESEKSVTSESAGENAGESAGASGEVSAPAAATEAEAEAEMAQEKTVSGTGGDITIKADGTHGAYTGSHAHSHSAFKEQGGDDNHEHEHSHDGDADHHHGHEDADEEADAAKSAPADGIETHGIEGPAADGVADGVADGAEQTVTLSVSAGVVVLDSQRAALLKTYQDMLTPLGFVVREASESTAAPNAAHNDLHKDLVDNDADAQRVISYMSNLDMYLDQASLCSDQLMDLLNIPDVDRDDDDDSAQESQDNSDVAGPRYPAGVSEALSGGSGVSVRRLLTRAGARNSAEDRASLQAIHDAVYALTDGMCCSAATETPEGGGDNADGADTASGNGGGQSATDLEEAQRLLGGGGSASMSILPQLIASIEAFGEVATTLKSLSLPALDEKVKALSAAVDAANAQQDALTAEQERTAGEIARLRGMPQGRPTASAQRSAATANTDSPIPVVTAESLTPAGQAREAAHALATAKAQTSVQYVAGVGQCRLWPASIGTGVGTGVGKDARPALTSLQRMALEMGFAAIRRALPASPDGAAPTSAEALVAAYTSGATALIPIVQDGE